MADHPIRSVKEVYIDGKSVGEEFKRKYEDMALPFGKFRGKLLADIPNYYLNWLLEQEWFEVDHPKIHTIAKMERDYRKKWHIEVE